MTLEDKDTVEAILRGDVRRFEDLVAKYNRMGGAIAFGVLGDFQRAEDVVQEAFLKAYRSLRDLRDPRRFRVWFAEIVRSRALDSARRRREATLGDNDEGFTRNAFRTVGGFPASPSAEEEQMRAEKRSKLMEAIGTLSVDDRTVFVLKHMDGLSYKEIAEATGASVSSVESRLFRARRALREKLSSTNLKRES
jgi:RNA polymerase sigma-70 factor (ECF subfamily)